MRFVLVPLVGYVLLYAPGRYVLRHTEPVAGEVSPLLREVLLSACCTSWIGILLAEFGYFSLVRLLLLVGGVAFAASALQRNPSRAGYGRRDATGLAICLFACLWMAPPLDTHLGGVDSTGYLASGAQLARHGTLVIHDPTLAKIDVDLKRALFPSVAPERGTPPYLRLNGSLILRSLDGDEVLPAFHHLLAVWIAAANALAGDAAGPWVITMFGGLSVWAIVECATLLGASPALLLPLLLLSGLQFWYSRFLMPELAGQFFLWAGLACVASDDRTAEAHDAVVAGLAFGIAGMMRTENILFLLVALAAVWLWIPPPSRRRHLVLVGCAAAVWLHSAIHLAVFRTHYYGILQQLLFFSVPFSPGEHVWLSLLLIGLAAVFVLSQHRMRRARWCPPLYASLLIGLLVVALWGGYQTNWSTLHLLIASLGVPTLLGGGSGMLLLVTRDNARLRAQRLLVLLTALVFAQVMIDPHAQPIPLWMARRVLTVILPAACVGLALLCRRIARQHRIVAVALLCSGVLGESRLFWQLRTNVDCYRGANRNVQAIAALIPAGARLLFDAQLVASGLPVSLWAERDLPAYFLPTGDSERIAELAAAFGEAPVYWISDGTQPLPHGDGINLMPVALYEFVMGLPRLDVGSALGAAADWQATIAVYRLRVDSHAAQ